MELTPEEKALLAATSDGGAKKPSKRREQHHTHTDEPTHPEPERGPLTPVQFSGDGWGDLPIQMRG